MKFNELDLTKKCRLKTWVDKKSYISFSDNDFLVLFYTDLSEEVTSKRTFILSKDDFESNDWEYLEEKKYQVLYARNFENCAHLSERKFASLEEFYCAYAIKKSEDRFAYLIDENGDRVK